jgi:Uma2 family endonuclease
MSTVANKTEYTAEDLLAMPDADHYELVNGALVERHMGWQSALVVGRLFYFLYRFCEEHLIGWVAQGGDAGYQGFPDSPRTVRKPDVSFVRYGRFPGEQPPQGFANLAPDLAAEVISPNDLYEEVDEKIEEYLRAGVRLVWVISPQNHTVRVYRLDGSSQSLREKDELSGEDVLPGFQCRVADLFPRPPATPQQGNGEPAPAP